MNAPSRGTPHKPKRKRRTKAELAALDGELCMIAEDSHPCTIRQVYYLGTTRYLCPKDDSGYNLVQRRLLSLRRAGAVPYGWIQDTVRRPYGRTRYRTLADFAAMTRHLYHHDYWHDAPANVQVWVESDSIAGTLIGTVVEQWGLDLHVARGFSSETYLWTAGQDIQEDGRETFVYVLSDFDPSGVTLAEDIARKIVRFSGDVPVHVERIALSGDQVREWNLPTRPLKKTDKRAPRFRLEHGDEACELEAIPPNLLRQLVSKAIARHVDPARIEAAKRDEALQRDALKKLPEWLRGAM